LPARHDATVGSTIIKAGTAAAIHLTHRGYIGDHHFFTNEECWYLAPELVYRGDDLPFGGFTSNICYTLVLSGDPADLRAQIEFGFTDAHTNPITNASVRAVLNAIPAVCDAEPGILVDDPNPHYRHDDRVTLS
jgi:2,4-diaminopentanoate dehydrogenase